VDEDGEAIGELGMVGELARRKRKWERRWWLLNGDATGGTMAKKWRGDDGVPCGGGRTQHPTVAQLRWRQWWSGE
jgi:hypothetical protein